MMRATICSATDWFEFSQCSSAGRTIESTIGRDFGIVEAIFRLALELRLFDKDAEHAGHALANVVGRQRDALGRQVVRVDVVADGLAQAGAQDRFHACRRMPSECR
jgi:hypothetical protein